MLFFCLLFTAKSENDKELNSKNGVELNIELKSDLTN